MMVIKWAGIVVLALAVIAIASIVAGQMGLLRGKVPADLGVKQGKLKGLSATPNCVSSQADLYPDHLQRHYSGIAPLALRGDGLATIAKLKTIVQSTANAKLITSEPDYLYAQYSTPLMKYVDDVEFWFDPASNAIAVRSASRLGQRDFDANRKRIEAVRSALATAP